mmetsp:Transcript_9170/g.11842  ORF Transcript_9170/g.11842 Transcript_9170/m.11842 type:complete len:88 (+) Transcript_9170:1825-2088(+)
MFKHQVICENESSQCIQYPDKSWTSIHEKVDPGCNSDDAFKEYRHSNVHNASFRRGRIVSLVFMFFEILSSQEHTDMFLLSTASLFG